jgi:prepilin-type N-terminal cleavage/methylation domain-containing protein/prepilin-type processing-associated H-X9-DG protein
VRRTGFTLIELLVVIAIIAILAAILFPVFAQAREQARKTACLSNEKQIALAVSMYRQDWDSRGPFAGWPTTLLLYSQDWQFSIQPYLKNMQILRCPSDKSPYADRPVSYLYNNMMAPNRLPVSEAQLNAPADVVMLWDGYGPKQSPVGKDPGPINGVIYPPNFNREYTAWGDLAEYLADPGDGLPRHSGGGNVVYMDLHAHWKRYGVGSTQKEWLQSVKVAFPFETAVDPGGVGRTVGEQDWLW